jgi:hypothetical protein
MKPVVAAAALLVAHFTATSVSGTAARTCGTVTATNATYSGPSMTIRAHSAIDARTGMGVVAGTLKSPTMTAQFSAVYDHGAISGTASGSMGARTLIASLSAVFSPQGGFTQGVIGARGSGGSLAVIPACAALPQKLLRHVQGIITSVNASEVTIHGLTCAVPLKLGIGVAVNYPIRSWAAMTCSVSNGVATLVTIRAKR